MDCNLRSGNERRRLFFSGVLFLSCANILVKIIGVFFKMPIANILSSPSLESGVGMGYFSTSYTVYTWLFMIATAGLPNGISIIIAEKRARGDAVGASFVFRKTLICFSIVGAVLFSIMFFGADRISNLVGNPGAGLSMKAIAPTLFFICLMSVLRGWFYGFGEMLSAAVSEVVEALSKLIFGVGGAYYALEKGSGAMTVAAYAVFGITVGVFLATGYLFVAKAVYNRKRKFLIAENRVKSEGESRILLRVLRLSLPITLASSVMSLSGLIDLGTMMTRLQIIGYSEAEASALYGTYTMLAVPMYNLPVVLITPLSSAIIPVISAYRTEHNTDAVINLTASTLRLVSLLAIPASLGLSAFAYPVLSLLYADSAAATAAPLLSVLAPATFFLSILTVMNALLQASGFAGKTVIAMSVGAGVKLLFGVILMGIPEIGVYGIPLSTVICYLTIAVLDLCLLRKYIGLSENILGFTVAIIRPFLAAFAAIFLVKGCLYIPFIQIMPLKAATVLSLFAVVIMYIAFLLVLRAISKQDLKLLPFGKKLIRLLSRYQLLRE